MKSEKTNSRALSDAVGDLDFNLRAEKADQFKIPLALLRIFQPVR
jgi:hypothetical protein